MDDIKPLYFIFSEEIFFIEDDECIENNGVYKYVPLRPFCEKQKHGIQIQTVWNKITLLIKQKEIHRLCF